MATSLPREAGRRNAKSPSSPDTTPRALGPVSDLERHLPPDWWRNLFNAVYLRTDGDVVEDGANTAREIDAILNLTRIEPEARVLDLCCGQGRHALELARRGFTHVTGMDRSRYLVRLARRRAKRESLDVTFREGDARHLRMPENSFDAVLVLGNSFGYFDRPEDDVSVLDAIARVTAPNGTVAFDLADGDWLRDNFERRSWEWIDRDHFVCRERSLSADGSRLVCREVVTHAEKGVIADQFYAERLYGPAQMADLLKAEGFREIRIHKGVDAESARNQDLGMMACRFLVTARTPPRTVRRGPSTPDPDVLVVLGDPRLPDSVKLGGQFNQEDLDTVARLKDALAEVPGYRFRYLDNHATLTSDLRASPPDFVLNLCDEGYNNDALKELHVPALLEMLAIPYTGAGPGCLGLCYDKGLVRAIAHALDVAVPLETYCGPDDNAATIPSVFPALLKPACGDSSLGITQKSVVRNAAEAVAYLAWLRETLPGRPVLVQEYLSGREYSVAIIGNPGLGHTVLPVLEVDYSALPKGLPPILAYESKWDPSSPYWNELRYKEAEAPEEQLRGMTDGSLVLFERLGCRDYARFDFRCDSEGVPKLLEVNPNPGWCWDGKLNLMAGFAGLEYPDLLRMILEAAEARLRLTGAEATAAA